MKKEPVITLSNETRAELAAEIRQYFESERGEEMGDLACGLMLDFIVEKIAPAFYNRGVEDSYRFMKDSSEDLLSLRK